MARPITSDPGVIEAYFQQVASYEANANASARRFGRLGLIVGAVGLVVGLAGIFTAASLAPLKTVVPIIYRVNATTGVVERVYDVKGGDMLATEATNRHDLWQYVRCREGYTAVEAQVNFDCVVRMSSAQVQAEYNNGFKGTNPNSPQVTLGQDGTASLRWISTAFLGPKLAQVRFLKTETKAGIPTATKQMVATIGFDQVQGKKIKANDQDINVNPLGFVVTSYRADLEVTQ